MLGLLLPPIAWKTVLTCLVWYLCSSVTSQLTKLVLVKFSYPLFLSQFQFLISACLALTFITIVKSVPTIADLFPIGSVPRDPNVATFQKLVLLKILPLGLFQFFGKFFSLSATSLIPLATVSSIKALSPLLIVLGYRVVYRVKFPFITYLSLTPLVGGVMLIIVSDLLQSTENSSLLSNEFNQLDYKQIKGLVFCILSTIVFASQNIYGKQLITWDSPPNAALLVLNTEISRASTPFDEKTGDSHLANFKPKRFIRQRTNSIKLPFLMSDVDKSYEQTIDQNNQSFNNPFSNIIDYQPVAKPDKLTIILYCSMIGFCFSIGGFAMNELPQIIRGIANIQTDLKGSAQLPADLLVVFLLIVLDSLSHFVQSLLAFHLLGSIPTLSYSIASMMKRIVLIAVSLVWVYDTEKKITTQQVYGLISIAVGLYAYDRWGSRSLKGHM